MKVRIFMNPGAGDHDHDGAALKDLFGRYGHVAEVHDSHADDLDRLLAGRHDVSVIAGGDGTVADVLARVNGSVAPISILPMGTANNVARGFGIDAGFEHLVAGMADGRLQPMDFGTVVHEGASRRFFESAGVGLLAAALGPVNARKVASADKIDEGMEALYATLQDLQPVALSIELDGTRREEQVLLVEAALMPTFGPGLRLAARAESEQGSFQLVLAREDDRQSLLQWMREDPDSPAPLHVASASEVRLVWKDASAHHDDHFHARGPGDWQLTLQAAAVQILTPRLHADAPRPANEIHDQAGNR